MDQKINFRSDVLLKDLQNVRLILESTGFFYPFEIDVALEVVREKLEKGVQSSYRFIFAEIESQAVGFCSFGEIPCTQGSFDLYWIAVRKDYQNRSIGRALLSEAEKKMLEYGARKVFVETSSRPLYEQTRNFYLRCGYRIEAILNDFYAPQDNKYIFVRNLR